jgi:Bacteriocin-protection, YdeI or OmpD-Associated
LTAGRHRCAQEPGVGFYRKAYLCWIDATTRRPDLRAARIAEVVGLLAGGIKQRPRE